MTDVSQNAIRRALQRPGLPILGYDLTPTGEKCGLILALAGPVPDNDGDLAAFSTGLNFATAGASGICSAPCSTMSTGPPTSTPTNSPTTDTATTHMAPPARDPAGPMP